MLWLWEVDKSLDHGGRQTWLRSWLRCLLAVWAGFPSPGVLNVWKESSNERCTACNENMWGKCQLYSGWSYVWILFPSDHRWDFLEQKPRSWRPVFGALGWPAWVTRSGGPELMVRPWGRILDTHLDAPLGWESLDLHSMSHLPITCIKKANPGLCPLLPKDAPLTPHGWYWVTHLGTSTRRKT